MKQLRNIAIVSCTIFSLCGTCCAGSSYFSILKSRNVRHSQPTQIVFESQPVAQYFVAEGEEQYQHTLAHVRGRQHIVFWRNPGCAPCDEQHDALRRYQEENPAVAIIEVNGASIPPEVRRNRYGVTYYPTTFFSTGAGYGRLATLREIRQSVRNIAKTTHQPVRRLNAAIARPVFQPIIQRNQFRQKCTAGG